MLLNVGRTAEAVEQLHQANDMLVLYVYTPLNLAQALVIAGKPNEAKAPFDAAIDLAPNAGFAKYLTLNKATHIGDIDLLLDPTLPISEELRAALLKGYRARTSSDSGARAQAVETLLALPEAQQTEAVARLLAAQGANREAFQVAARIATTKEYPGPTIFWDQRMRGALADPGFPALATQLGLFEILDDDWYQARCLQRRVSAAVLPDDLTRLMRASTRDAGRRKHTQPCRHSLVVRRRGSPPPARSSR